MALAPVLQVKDLSKRYGKQFAVRGVSFEVAPGEVFALIGPNGAGKSTSLRMIATLLTPTSGSITVAGHDRNKDAGAVRATISYLPEEAGAYKNLSGRQYLEFMASLYFADGKRQREAVQYGQEVCGLGARLNDKIGEYSKGMTRKLLIARTVMAKPQLAILDEPTSGLDVVNAFEVRSIVKQLAKDGMAVLLSSHNMLEIEFLSDRVSIINKGTILATGTPAQLMKAHNARNLEEVFVRMVK